jgi:glyoxylase-like metal-dependent hydrolase (beta-lactamase superfamily II)
MVSLKLGNARISIFNLGDLRCDLAEWLGLREWPTQYNAALAQPIAIPMQNVLIEIGDAKVLVDTSCYDKICATEYGLPNYTPPPSLIEQLAEIGIAPNAITHVVITHAHFDHFNGLASLSGAPIFSNAKHFLSRADWEWDRIRQRLQDASSCESQTLGQLHQLGQLNFISGDADICEGIRILAAPGETPGHQVVRVQSEGKTLYCIGDLIHHPVELETGWDVTWADAALNQLSRAHVFEAALREEALVIAGHIAGAGKIEKVPHTSESAWHLVTQ